MHIIGTAGHVDHGKSTLVAALTGVNPDRLKEEIAREMTIDLGFASLTLPNGEQIGIIDVPGHRDFIGNMLSGIGSIDAAMLIIASDEGVSPQTREHLDILDLLDVNKGVVVLTKIDLVTDPEWLDLVEMEAAELLAPTSLAEAPIVRVSSKTGEGLDHLLQVLQSILVDIPPKPDLGRPRLPVDRVFTLTGFGTIVTGTLLDGTFTIGDEVVCLPAGMNGRIRGLQNNKQKLQKVHPGFRTAINITGLEKDQIARGDVIAHPGTYLPTHLLDARLRLLTDAGLILKHNMEVKLFVGAAETTAQLRLLGVDAMKPGDSAFIQLKLAHPIIAARGDHFILRLPSPSVTLGGGLVLDPYPERLHRRFNQELLSSLEKLYSGKEADLLLQSLTALGVATAKEAILKSGLEEAKAMEWLAALEKNGNVIVLPSSRLGSLPLLATANTWQQQRSKILTALAAFHQASPLKAGISREALRAQLKLAPESFDSFLAKLDAQDELRQNGTLLSLSAHQVTMTPSQEIQASSLLVKFEQNPYSPPDFTEAVQAVGAGLLEGLVASGRLIQVSDQVLFTPNVIKEMTAWVRETLNSKETLTLAEFRDRFKTSRKYAAAFLEYLDSIGITLRKGDVRILKRVK